MAEDIGTLIARYGADTKDFDRKSARVKRTFEKDIPQAAQRSFGTLAKAGAGFALGLAGVTAGIGLLKSSLSGTVGAAISFESSFAGIRKTVDATEEEFAQLASGMRSMAQEIPANVNELNRIGEAAGQLGIETENIVEFTRVMADLGETTNLAGDQAATIFARLANITGLAQTDFDRLGSTVVDLGNNFATTEAEIANMALRVSAAGTQIGLSVDEILAFSAAMTSAGIRAEAGGTAISRVFVDMASSVENADDKIAKFAEVAGLSIEEFSTLFKEDASEAVLAFVDGLRQISDEGGNVFGTLEQLDLDGIRVRDTLLRLTGAGDLFANALDTASTAWEENTALTAEAELRYATTAAQIDILRNKFADIGITIGQEMVPVLLRLLDFGAQTVDMLGELGPVVDFLADVFPSLAIGIGAFITVIAISKVFAFVALMGEFMAIAQGFGGVGAVLRTNLAPAIIAAFSSPLAALTAFSIAIVGVDLALRAFTGSGIMGNLEKLFGRAADKFEVATDAAERFSEAFIGLTATQGIAEIDEQMASLSATVGVLRVELDRMIATNTGQAAMLNAEAYTDWRDAVDEAAGTFAAAVPVWREMGLSIFDIGERFQALPPVVQEAAASMDGVRPILIELDNIVKNNAFEMDEWIRTLKDLPPAADDAAGAVRDGASAYDEYMAKLAPALQGTKDLADAYDELTARLSTNLPEVIAANAEIAINAERIGELEGLTRDLTAAEADELKILEDRNEELGTTIKLRQDEADAIEPIITNLARLTGNEPGSYVALSNVMLNAGSDGDALVKALGEVNLGLQSVDPARAIGGLETLKEALDPESWEAAAKDLMPGVFTVLGDSVTGADAMAMLGLLEGLGSDVIWRLSQGVTLGIPGLDTTGKLAIESVYLASLAKVEETPFESVGNSIAMGIAAGLIDPAAIAAVSGAAVALTDAALAAALANIQAGSPSKRFADEVGLPIAQGIALGITQGSDVVGSALGGVMNAALVRIASMGPAIAAAMNIAFEDAPSHFTGGAAGALVALGLLPGHPGGQGSIPRQPATPPPPRTAGLGPENRELYQNAYEAVRDGRVSLASLYEGGLGFLAEYALSTISRLNPELLGDPITGAPSAFVGGTAGGLRVPAYALAGRAPEGGFDFLRFGQGAGGSVPSQLNVTINTTGFVTDVDALSAEVYDALVRAGILT